MEDPKIEIKNIKNNMKKHPIKKKSKKKFHLFKVFKSYKDESDNFKLALLIIIILLIFGCLTKLTKGGEPAQKYCVMPMGGGDAHM